MTVRTNLLLPRELVEEVDRFAGARGRSRYVAEALEERLRRDRLRIAVESTSGSIDVDHYPHWSTSDDVVDWVREMRREVTSGPVDER